jgi:hypothetical protein
MIETRASEAGRIRYTAGPSVPCAHPTSSGQEFQFLAIFSIKREQRAELSRASARAIAARGSAPDSADDAM